MAYACAWINEQKNEMFRLLAFGEARLGGYTGFLKTGIIKQGENHPPPPPKNYLEWSTKCHVICFRIIVISLLQSAFAKVEI